MTKSPRIDKPLPPFLVDLLGIATLIPCLALVFFIVTFTRLFSSFESLSQNQLERAFIGLFVCQLISGFWSLTCTIYYFVYLFRSHRIDPINKALWAVVLWLGQPVSGPIFWYLHFWRPSRETP